MLFKRYWAVSSFLFLPGNERMSPSVMRGYILQKRLATYIVELHLLAQENTFFPPCGKNYANKRVIFRENDSFNSSHLIRGMRNVSIIARIGRHKYVKFDRNLYIYNRSNN